MSFTNLNQLGSPVDKFRSDSPRRARITPHFTCPGSVSGSRSFRKAEIRYDSVMRSLTCWLLGSFLLAALGGMALETRAQTARDVGAGPRMEAPPRQDSARQNDSSSLSDAVRRVQRETGGQVLGAERIQYDGRDINRVKVMDDRGRVRYMDDDPQRSRESFDRRREPVESTPRARGDNPRRP